MKSAGRYALVAAAGALAVLGFAPFAWWPLTALGLMVLLVAVQGHSAAAAFRMGLGFGTSFFACGIYWVYISTVYYGNAPPWLGVILVILLSGFLALYGAAVLALAAPLSTRQVWPWLLAALWGLGELLRGTVLGGFPWLSLGYAFIDSPLQRLAPLIGAHGISVVVVLTCALAARLVGSQGRRFMPTTLMALASLVLLVAALPDAESWTEDAGPSLSVRLVQGNIEQARKWQPRTASEAAKFYRDQTLLEPAVDLVVWPEVAVPWVFPQAESQFYEPLAQLTKARGSTVLLGTLLPNDDASNMLNSVVAIGASQGQYLKRHLVPFGEVFPLPDFLRPLLDVMDLRFAELDTGDEGQPPVMVNGVPISVSICFEDAFGDEIAREASKAQILVNVTNDAWFHDSSAPPQHLDLARMRSLETGRYLIKVAQTGISGLVGPDGTLLQSIPQFKAGHIDVPVPARTGLTPYMRVQDWPLWLLGLGAILIVGVSGLRRRRRHAAG